MCTVTYVPQGSPSFILTSSRDESVKRDRALPPENYKLDTIQAIFPKDSAKGGTWIGCSSNQRTLCLLNGAFEKHEPSDQFIKSRGLVVLDFFTADNIQDFVNRYSFENVEPFTLIIIEYVEARILYEFRWDGNQKHLNQLDDQANHIWSSCTLYTPEEANEKATLFQQYLEGKHSAEDLLTIHLSGVESNAEIFKYHGIPEIETLSITQIQLLDEHARMTYHMAQNSAVYEMCLTHQNKMSTINRD